jgi:hypothetical protein
MFTYVIQEKAKFESPWVNISDPLPVGEAIILLAELRKTRAVRDPFYRSVRAEEATENRAQGP